MRPREGNQVDRNLFFDRLTLGIIRHAVVASDGAIYEARSLLQILQNAGMSLVNPAHRLTFAVSVPAIQNTINSYFEADEERNDDYDLDPVMAAIQRHLPREAPVEITESTLAAAIHTALGIIQGLSAAAGYGCAFSMAILLTPLVNIIALTTTYALFGNNSGMYNFIGSVLEVLPKATFISIGTCGISKFGIFAGEKLGFFRSYENRDDHHLQAAPG